LPHSSTSDCQTMHTNINFDALSDRNNDYFFHNIDIEKSFKKSLCPPFSLALHNFPQTQLQTAKFCTQTLFLMLYRMALTTISFIIWMLKNFPKSRPKHRFQPPSITSLKLNFILRIFASKHYFLFYIEWN